MLCRERREISLTVLLVNYHDVTGRISTCEFCAKPGMKSPLEWHKQPGKNTRLLESLETTMMEVVFRSEDRDSVVKENSVLPCNGALYSKKIVEEKMYGCNMVIGPYLQTLACVRRGRGVYNISIGRKLHAQLRFSKTRLGSTRMFSSEPPESLTDKAVL